MNNYIQGFVAVFIKDNPGIWLQVGTGKCLPMYPFHQLGDLYNAIPNAYQTNNVEKQLLVEAISATMFGVSMPRNRQAELSRLIKMVRLLDDVFAEKEKKGV